MSHYFTNDYVKSEEKVIKTKIGNDTYSFYVDNGVFSKRALDFGTRTLLENLDIERIKGDVLDFGCGYGPIGIFVAKNTDAYVDMIDVNERSLSLAGRNAIENKVTVNVFKSNIYSAVLKTYDFIITNPPIRVGKKILYEILMGAYDYLNPEGELWLVVNKDQGAKSLVRDLTLKYETEVVEKNKGFYVIKAKKRWQFAQKYL